jgi:hypothetical protein
MAEQSHPFDFGSPDPVPGPTPGFTPPPHNFIPHPGEASQVPHGHGYDTVSPQQGEQPVGFGIDLNSDRVTYRDKKGNVHTGAAIGRAVGGEALRGAFKRVVGGLRKGSGTQPAAPKPAEQWDPQYPTSNSHQYGSSSAPNTAGTWSPEGYTPSTAQQYGNSNTYGTGAPQYGTDYGYGAAPQPTYGYGQQAPAPGGWGPNGYASPGAQGYNQSPQPPQGKQPHYGPPDEKY